MALDSSTLTLSLALAHSPSGPMLETIAQGPPSKQSELLPGAIGELLARHGLKVRDLKGVVVGLGPGSFTGLRIGVATVKGLAHGLGFPVEGLSSLEAVAWAGPEGAVLLTCALARRDELYVAQWVRDSASVSRKSPDEAWSLDETCRWLRDHPEAIALGPGVNEYEGALLAGGASERQLFLGAPFPTGDALLALSRFDLEQTKDARRAALRALEPVYVRTSAAERNPKFPPAPGPEPSSRLRDP